MPGLTEVAKAAGVKEEVVKAVYQATAKLAATERVTIKGFGSFETVTRAAREGRNPQSGEKIQIQAKRVLSFKVAKPKTA